eukprot:1194808-Prorocentrum_minimum.AAC.3
MEYSQSLSFYWSPAWNILNCHLPHISPASSIDIGSRQSVASKFVKLRQCSCASACVSINPFEQTPIAKDGLRVGIVTSTSEKGAWRCGGADVAWTARPFPLASVRVMPRVADVGCPLNGHFAIT